MGIPKVKGGPGSVWGRSGIDLGRFQGGSDEVLGRFWRNSWGDLGALGEENGVASLAPDPAPRKKRQRRPRSACSTARSSLRSPRRPLSSGFMDDSCLTNGGHIVDAWSILDLAFS